MFKEMTDAELLDFCEDNFCEYSICQALGCDDNCKDEDCPLVQLFDRFKKSAVIATDINVGNKSEWISVDERLPDIEPSGKGRYGGARSVRVLCACKQRGGRTFVKEGYYEPCGNGNVVWRIPGSIDSVTHWMPLPELPKMKGDEHG